MTMRELWDKQMQDPDFYEYCIEMIPITSAADAVLDARVACDMTQKQLAKASGVPRKTIRRLEDLDGDPRLSTLHKLARAMGMTVRVTFEPLPE